MAIVSIIRNDGRMVPKAAMTLPVRPRSLSHSHRYVCKHSRRRTTASLSKTHLCKPPVIIDYFLLYKRYHGPPSSEGEGANLENVKKLCQHNVNLSPPLKLYRKSIHILARGVVNLWSYNPPFRVGFSLLLIVFECLPELVNGWKFLFRTKIRYEIELKHGSI